MFNQPITQRGVNMDDFEDKPVLPSHKDIINTIAPHTYKTEEELTEWWIDGVGNILSEPLAAWKTDNPNHPGYQKQDTFDPTLEEV
jgi:hypothetical protein